MPKEFSNLSQMQRRRRIINERKKLLNNSNEGIGDSKDVTYFVDTINNNESNNVDCQKVEEKLINYGDGLDVNIRKRKRRYSCGNLSKYTEDIFSRIYDDCQTKKYISSLRLWINKFNISQTALSELLKISRKCFSTCCSDSCEKPCKTLIPSDARVLMKTPRNASSNVVSGNGGKTIYFGLEYGLMCSIKKYYPISGCPSKIKINLNVDGLPLSKSSNSQFWPIFAVVSDPSLKYSEPFVVQVFHGMNKPLDSNDFLQRFVEEALVILQNGLKIEKDTILVVINAIICDAPARSFITGTKNHTGYFACSRCNQQGTYFKNRVTYAEVNSTLRSDKSFIERQQPKHHKHYSILETLNIGMVSQIPIDYMHLVCLGVMKRLLLFWVRGKKSVSLKEEQVKYVSKILLDLNCYIPKEFERKQRRLEDIERWKASELRTFLLYTGPIVLKDILSAELFDHFLSLSIAIRILCQPDLYLRYNEFSCSLLRWFVKKYSKLYGREYVTYNVHNLIHLAADAKNMGPLDHFSAFKFENKMYKIKQKLKNSRNPLQQLANRLQEENDLVDIASSEPTFPSINYSKRNNSVLSVTCKNYVLSKKMNDNCILLKDETICFITDYLIDGDIKLIVKKYAKTKPYFLEPCNSNILGILEAEMDNFKRDVIELHQIKSKCFSIPFGNSFIIMSFIH